MVPGGWDPMMYDPSREEEIRVPGRLHWDEGDEMARQPMGIAHSVVMSGEVVTVTWCQALGCTDGDRWPRPQPRPDAAR